MDVVPVNARMDRLDALLVRMADEVVEGALLVGGLTHDDRAGHVAAVVAEGRAVIHEDEVALLDDPVARYRMRVGRIGPGGDDGAEGEAVGAVLEHEVLEFGPRLLLGHTRTQDAQHVLEGGVGDLRAPHELDLLGILDGAHDLQVLMHERQRDAHGQVLEGALEGAEEPDLHVVLDRHHAAARIAGSGGDPARDIVAVHIDLPGVARRKVLLEGVEVPRVGVEKAGVTGDDGSMGILPGVIEHALSASRQRRFASSRTTTAS